MSHCNCASGGVGRGGGVGVGEVGVGERGREGGDQVQGAWGPGFGFNNSVR